MSFIHSLHRSKLYIEISKNKSLHLLNDYVLLGQKKQLCDIEIIAFKDNKIE